MRDRRISSSPLPKGKGFSFLRSRALLAVAIAAAAFVPSIGGAATTVGVTLRVSTLAYANTDVLCSVSVPAGSNGTALLQAAVTKGCINGYTLTAFASGHLVDCIDDGKNGNRCGDPAPAYVRYWAMRENCNYVTYAGVDEFVANQGDELSFTYETIATFLVPAVKPDGTVCS